MEREALVPVEARCISLTSGDDRQLDLVEYLGDDWLHIINGSDWKMGHGTPKSVLAAHLLVQKFGDIV